MVGRLRASPGCGSRDARWCSPCPSPRLWTSPRREATVCRMGPGANSEPSPTTRASRSWSCSTVRPAYPGREECRSKASRWIGSATTGARASPRSPPSRSTPDPNGAARTSRTTRAEITRQLISFAGDRLGTELAPAIVETSLARWRYSWVTNPHPEPFFAGSEDPPLLFCGDAFGQPKVEGAALSGLAAADHLLG